MEVALNQNNNIDKKTLLILFLIFIILLLIILVTILCIKIYNDNNKEEIIINNSPTPTIIEEIDDTDIPTVTNTIKIIDLVKSFQTEILPFTYSFKYYSNWEVLNNIKQGNTLNLTLGPKSAKDENNNYYAINSFNFRVNLTIEITDPAISELIETKSIFVERYGDKYISYYRNYENNEYFYFLKLNSEHFIIYVYNDKKEEALNNLKEIFKTYNYNESPNAI